MESVAKIASYVSERYKKIYGQRIDEMKLHKLLYFIQRECIAQTDEPLFDATFHAWLYGPVLPEVRSLYKNDQLHELPSVSVIQKYKPVFDEVFTRLAGSSSLLLVSISHGELSWRRAREGYGKYDSSDVPMKLDDIKEDARRYKERCQMLQDMFDKQNVS